ncbi:hypothetical protein [Barnesiella sp. An55]|uniref:hypothetical protein n=1 Tax=Barnesiella sp. An55 TaxID=1965646 RepID=UPI000B39A415|nr:hypothetical protein [Barnesiella sp. An55]OUN73949.1 hypothetical protein B5G10_02670 [Barnesiella sp. An55]HIZ26919.1 PorT family protein [Candidatus Barnesiella merdipullorum]
MKKLITTALVAILAIHASAQLRYISDSFRMLSYQAYDGDMGGGDLSYEYLKDQWPTDDNGDPAALLVIKFRNMLPDESRRFQISFTAGCNKAGEEFPTRDKHPDSYWLYVTAGDHVGITIYHPEYGSVKVGPLKLEQTKMYEFMLENEKSINLSFATDPPGSIVIFDDQRLPQVTPCEKKNTTYGEHRLFLISGATQLDTVIHVDGSRSHFDFNMRKKHFFNFTCEQDDAQLYINGKLYGRLPQSNVPLYEGLSYTLVALKGGIGDTVSWYVDDNVSREYQFQIVKKKTVELYASYQGERVNAYLTVNRLDGAYHNHQLQSSGSSFRLNLPYGRYRFRMSYGGNYKERTEKISEKSKSIYEFPIKAKNSIVWPWQREYDVRPVGFSMGYVSKQLVTTGNGMKLKENGFWSDGEGTSLHGMQVGLHFQPCFSFGLGLYTGAFYELYMSFNDDGYAYDEFLEHCAYVPVHLYYRLPFSSTVALSFHGGVGFNYSIYGAFGKKDDSVEEYTDCYGEAGYPKRFNMAAEVGVGFRIGSIQINAQYAKGLNDHKSYSSLGSGYKTIQNKLSISLSWLISSGY